MICEILAQTQGQSDKVRGLVPHQGNFDCNQSMKLQLLKQWLQIVAKSQNIGTGSGLIRQSRGVT